MAMKQVSVGCVGKLTPKCHDQGRRGVEPWAVWLNDADTAFTYGMHTADNDSQVLLDSGFIW